VRTTGGVMQVAESQGERETGNLSGSSSKLIPASKLITSKGQRKFKCPRDRTRIVDACDHFHVPFVE
jgi:hypothetical protein